jgi:rhodanese-related sulfurtransferase
MGAEIAEEYASQLSQTLENFGLFSEFAGTGRVPLEVWIGVASLPAICKILLWKPNKLRFDQPRPPRQTILRRHQSKYERLKEVRMESTISTEDLKAKLDRKEPVTVVETLAPEGFREAHIPGALNIPPEQIKELAPKLLPNKDAEIVTYCTSAHWHASEYAARELADIGYTNVAHYPEGKLGWMEAGLPVKKAA